MLRGQGVRYYSGHTAKRHSLKCWGFSGSSRFGHNLKRSAALLLTKGGFFMEVFAVPPQELILSPVLTVWSPHNQSSVLFAASHCVPIVWPITQSNVIKTRGHQHSTGVITFDAMA